MAFSITVDVTGPKFRPPAEMKREIGRALKLFNDYYRKRVAGRFAAQGPGWPPKVDKNESDEHADKRVNSLVQHKLQLKILQQLRRAQRNFRKGKGTSAAIVRRARVFQEFRKQVAGDQSPFFNSDRRLEKSVRGLRERMGRAESNADARILGRISNSMKSKFQGMVLEVISTIPWAGVQNDGGAVGRGAQLPARPFNFFDAMDGEVFAEIVANCMLVALS